MIARPLTYDEVYGGAESAAHSDESNLTVLLDEVAELLTTYVAFPSPEATVAVTLWATHAHVLDAFESTPRLALLSPEKQSGKTRCLEVLELLVPKPARAVDCSTAALFRMVEANRPTLLFDECDAVWGPKATGKGEREELRALINAGHRRGAVAYRCVGDPAKMQVRTFPAFAAVALAGIGDLPDTILDRAVVIRMRRRAPEEHVEPFRYRRVAPVAFALRDRLAEWRERAVGWLGRAEPDMPPGLTDRPADVWEPLVAVADAAGGDWPERARQAAVTLNAERATSDGSLGVLLLSDVRDAFRADGSDRLSTEELLRRLVAIEEGPWGDLRGRALDARGLAWRLKPYAVASRKLRIGDSTPRGYSAEDFYDAWKRYIPPLPQRSGTAGTTGVLGGERVPDDASRSGAVAERDGQPATTTMLLSRAVPPVPRVPQFQARERS